MHQGMGSLAVKTVQFSPTSSRFLLFYKTLIQVLAQSAVAGIAYVGIKEQ